MGDTSKQMGRIEKHFNCIEEDSMLSDKKVESPIIENKESKKTKRRSMINNDLEILDFAEDEKGSENILCDSNTTVNHFNTDPLIPFSNLNMITPINQFKRKSLTKGRITPSPPPTTNKKIITKTTAASNNNCEQIQNSSSYLKLHSQKNTNFEEIDECEIKTGSEEDIIPTTSLEKYKPNKTTIPLE